MWERWAVHAKYLSDDMKAKGHIGRLSVIENIILKWVLKELGYV